MVNPARADKAKVSVLVVDPNQKTVFKRVSQVQGVIQFKTTVPGEYNIIFHASEDVHVTLALHTGEESYDIKV